MIHLNRLLFLILILSMQIFSQNKIDTARANKDTHDGRKQMNSNTRHETSNKIQLLNGDFFVPLNLKIYQKVILNDYIVSHKFSQEELSTGMSDDGLIAFERNRLRFKRMLSDIYGEDFIDIEGLLTALGITREQIIALAAILKFFLFSTISIN